MTNAMSWVVQKEEAPMLLRTFLREKKSVSKRLLAAVKFKGGQLEVNGQEVTVRHLLQPGDTVRMVLPPEYPTLQPEPTPFMIHFEDDHILVAEKKAGMSTIPSREHPYGSLAQAVLHYYQEHQIQATFHAVNRLDKGTSGLLLIAKHGYAHERMSQLQKQGQLKRCYQALIQGQLPPTLDVIDAPIGRQDTSIITREVRADGKCARTHVKTGASSPDYSLIELQLETGRTHQIRVHLAYIGYPLVGDELYGGQPATFAHQALHCHKLAFKHPFSGEWLSFQLALPFSWFPYMKGMACTCE
ncbi:RluA family pseudouridine synthase [Bacillus sp. FSL W7-1360]